LEGGDKKLKVWKKNRNLGMDEFNKSKPTMNQNPRNQLVQPLVMSDFFYSKMYSILESICDIEN